MLRNKKKTFIGQNTSLIYKREVQSTNTILSVQVQIVCLPSEPELGRSSDRIHYGKSQMNILRAIHSLKSSLGFCYIPLMPLTRSFSFEHARSFPRFKYATNSKCLNVWIFTYISIDFDLRSFSLKILGKLIPN